MSCKWIILVNGVIRDDAFECVLQDAVEGKIWIGDVAMLFNLVNLSLTKFSLKFDFSFGVFLDGLNLTGRMLI